METNTKIAFITAVYGDYESSCKPMKPQTIPCDFICFTDNPDIEQYDWIIDNEPYHLTHPSPLDTSTQRNSLKNNMHTFNQAKFYKQQFHTIPRLQKYDVIVWLDATIEVLDENAAKYCYEKATEHNIVGWSHENSRGKLVEEMNASNYGIKYTSTEWLGQKQPYQDVEAQYNDYVKMGYTDTFWEPHRSENSNVGVWITCFVAFNMQNKVVRDFLDLWYTHTLIYTTQDQISFPYICFHTGIIPYTLPNKEVAGEKPHCITDFYYKHRHG